MCECMWPLHVCGHCMYVVTPCMFLTGLGRLSLNVPCVLILAQLLLLQLAARDQNLPLGFLATESDAMTETHMSMGYR